MPSEISEIMNKFKNVQNEKEMDKLLLSLPGIKHKMNGLEKKKDDLSNLLGIKSSYFQDLNEFKMFFFFNHIAEGLLKNSSNKKADNILWARLRDHAFFFEILIALIKKETKQLYDKRPCSPEDALFQLYYKDTSYKCCLPFPNLTEVFRSVYKDFPSIYEDMQNGNIDRDNSSKNYKTIDLENHLKKILLDFIDGGFTDPQKTF